MACRKAWMVKGARMLALSLVVGGVSARTCQAELIDRGGGVIYDTVLNVSWLQNANFSESFGFTNGSMTWTDAAAWVDSLEVLRFGSRGDLGRLAPADHDPRRDVTWL